MSAAFVVIFRAQIRQLDEQYSRLAQQLRQKAFDEYGCVDFSACAEAGLEIALSYWNSREDIERWYADPLHRQAQALGKSRWYSDYSVEICALNSKRQATPDTE